jgi:hypothetical protein
MSIYILTCYRAIRLKISGYENRLAEALEPLLFISIGAASFVFMTSIVVDLARAIWN